MKFNMGFTEKPQGEIEVTVTGPQRIHIGIIFAGLSTPSRRAWLAEVPLS